MTSICQNKEFQKVGLAGCGGFTEGGRETGGSWFPGQPGLDVGGTVVVVVVVVVVMHAFNSSI